MSCDERTALLAKQTQRGQHHHQAPHSQHIIVLPTGKDAKDYEPVFTTADHSYGLTLEELLPYKLDPWWQAMRRLCLACLGLAFALTLLAALLLAHFHADACRPNRVITTTLMPLLLSTSPPAALASNGTLLQLAS